MHDDWRARCPEKVCTAEEAVRKLRPGRRVLVGSGAAEPEGLVRAMVSPSLGLTDMEVVHLLTLERRRRFIEQQILRIAMDRQHHLEQLALRHGKARDEIGG